MYRKSKSKKQPAVAGKRRAGVALLEVLISAGLFSVGLMAVFALSSQLRRVETMTDEFSEAMLLAESKVESFEALPLDQLSKGAETRGRYALDWTVTTNTALNTVTAQIKVSWTNLDANVHSVNLNTILTE